MFISYSFKNNLLMIFLFLLNRVVNCLIFVLLFFSADLLASIPPVELFDRNTTYEIDSNYYRVFDPASGKETHGRFLYMKNIEADKDLWTTFTLYNSDTVVREWYLICNNYSVDEI